MTFAVTPEFAEKVRKAVQKMIAGEHVGINGSYEEGVIDTLEWILGKSPYISHERDWTKVKKPL